MVSGEFNVKGLNGEALVYGLVLWCSVVFSS